MKPEDLVAKIKSQAPTVELEAGPFGVKEKRWLVEGDVGLRESDLLVYAQERIDLAERVTRDPSERPWGLVAVTANGKLVRWSRGKVLDYCVYRPLFDTEEEYQQVVDNMRLATAEWSSICGVRFEYRADQDTNENLQLGDVLFPVVRQKGGGNTLAMAFFPNETDENNEPDLKRRIVWVFDGYFAGGGFDAVGILRHELGHVLGFRHEHIRPEAPDVFGAEPTEDTRNLTDYDPTSVMHYVAAGVGDPELRFTAADTNGARQVYGPPDSDCEFCD